MNTINDLNKQLFDQLERLNSDVDDETLVAEISRAKAMAHIGSVIVNNNKVALDAIKLMAAGKVDEEMTESILGNNKKLSL